MITFKQFLGEEGDEYLLYRNIGRNVVAELQAGKSVPITKKFVSFVRDKSHLKTEFGPCTIIIRSQELPRGVKVIPIQYDLAWFTQSKLHRELLQFVTGRDEDDWLEFGDLEQIDNELETIYGEEKEVVLVGLKAYDPKYVKVMK